MASKSTQISIKWKINCVRFLGILELILALSDCLQMMIYPVFTKDATLPLSAWFPFSKESIPSYEILWIWQWLTGYCAIFIIVSFDMFMWIFVMNVAMQFLILQDVLKKNSSWNGLVQCVKQHHMLMRYVYVNYCKFCKLWVY